MHFYEPKKPKKIRKSFFSSFPASIRINLLWTSLTAALLIIICIILSKKTDVSLNIEDILWLIPIWIALPLLLSIFTTKLLGIPYELFLGFDIVTYKNQDLFTSITDRFRNRSNDDKIEINIFLLSNYEDKDDDKCCKRCKRYLQIEQAYSKLIMFWYSQKYHIIKLRSTFPMLALLMGSIYFFIILWLLDNIDTLTNIDKSILISISLIVLYFALTSHINKFLDSQFYIDSILDSFKKVNFKNIKHTHKVKLFFDKNFLVYIHDNKHNRHICLNNDKSFNNLILNGKFDKEGRNLIIMVFISLFLILFVELSVNVLVDSKVDEIFTKKDKNQTNPIKVKIIKDGL